MKANLNRAVKASGTKVDEVFLFRVMAQEFNSSVSRCTYVREIHQKSYVTYPSKLSAAPSPRVELGDLWIFTFDKATKELRMCIMQTKYREKRYYRFLDLNIDAFQWELLKDKPDVIGWGWSVPKDILNFQKVYESITAYGIFYHDNISKSRDIDFLYTLPAFLKPKASLSPPLLKKNYRFGFMCPNGLGSPNRLCNGGFLQHETISACSIDVFEQQVLSCRVGVPVGGGGASHILSWVLELLKNMREGAEDETVINTILEQTPAARDSLNQRYSFDETPRALVIVTDSEEYKSFRGKKEEICG